MRQEAEQAKKEQTVLKKEGGSLFTSVPSDNTSIPTSPIMISTEPANEFKFNSQQFLPHKQQPRKQSTSSILSQEELVGQLVSININDHSEGSCARYISTFQRRRASVDEGSILPESRQQHSGTRSNSISIDSASLSNTRSKHQRIPQSSPTQSGDLHAGVYLNSDKRITLYKTEMCRTFEETGICKYGIKCQFAHDRSELRNIQRHPRYKTEICKTFWEQGNCPYGKRCCFIHTENEIHTTTTTTRTNLAEEMRTQPTSPEKTQSKLLNRWHVHDTFSSCSLPATSAMNIFKFDTSGSTHFPPSWSKNSFREDHFLDFPSTGPIGTPSTSHPFTIGSLQCKKGSRMPTINDPLFESISVPSDGGNSDAAWEEDSIGGLLPADLIQNA